MYFERHDFSLRLTLVSDLHIGHGNTMLLSKLRAGLASGKSDPGVATVPRDCASLPYIPSTSLKGAVRALVENRDVAKALFGVSPDRNGVGGIGGRLILWQARMDEQTLPTSLDLPYWSRDRATFINAHVRINRHSGAADKGRLFFREYVPRGSAFNLDACWLGDLDDLEAHIVPLLSEMRSRFGFAVGAAKGAGFGRARLENERVEITSKSLRVDPDTRRAVVNQTRSELPVPQPSTKEYLELQILAEGPFLIADPVRARRAGVESDILPLHRDPTMPELLGTSLIGYLRSRASWLEQTRFGGTADDSDLKFVASETVLTRTQRLFGVPGWAGMIRIANIELATTPTSEHPYPAIQLDDFTQGAIFGALFHIRAPANVGFDITLELGNSRRPLTSADRNFLKVILSDLAIYGLKLGRSEGGGFGWFKLVKQSSGPLMHTAESRLEQTNA